VHLSGGRVLDVHGSGAYTLYRHVDDTTPAWQRSPFAGCWILASPTFTAEIAQAEAAVREDVALPIVHRRVPTSPSSSSSPKLRMAKASLSPSRIA